MRHYELVVVLSPMIGPMRPVKPGSESKASSPIGKQKLSTKSVGEPAGWPTRFKKGQFQFLEGNYHLTRFSTDSSFNRDLENYLKLDDNVLRSLVTATLSEEELAAHAAQTRAPRPPRAPAGAAPGGASAAAGQAPAVAPEAPTPAPEGAEAAAPVAEATPAATEDTAPPADETPAESAPPRGCARRGTPGGNAF